jgi:hypothetical protein
MNRMLWWVGGGVAAWWLLDHIAIDQGGTGFSFPFRTEADRKRLEEERQKQVILNLPRSPLR